MAIKPVAVQVHGARSHRFTKTRVGIAGVQSIPNNAETALTFTSEAENEEGLNPGVPTNILTITRPGLWMIQGFLEWAANATGYRELEIVDPFNVASLAQVRYPASPTLSTFQVVTVVFRKTTSARADVGLQVRQTSGAALDVLGSTTMLVVTNIGLQ